MDKHAHLGGMSELVAVKEEKMDETPGKVEEDAKMKDALRVILATANLEEFTKKQARRQLEKALGKEEGSLEEMKAKIGEWVDTLMQEKEAAEGGQAGDEDEESAEEEEQELKPRRVKKEFVPKVKKEKKAGGGGGGFGKEVFLKPALAEFTGMNKCARTTVVKLIWQHVKANGLQDEKNKQWIIVDDRLRPLFGPKKKVHMFGMNKDLVKHFGEQSKEDEAREEREAAGEESPDDDETPAPRKAAKAPAAKKTPASKKKKKRGEDDEDAPPAKKRKAGGGFAAPVGLSKELADLLGSKELPRTEVVRGLWQYIKANELQNPEKKSEIIPDAKMQRIFGKDNFTGFYMMKLLTPHITKLEKV